MNASRKIPKQKTHVVSAKNMDFASEHLQAIQENYEPNIWEMFKVVSIKEFNIGEMVGLCPRCKHELVIRKGKYGLFIGCTNFPKCKKTFDYDGFRVQPEAIERRLEEARGCGI